MKGELSKIMACIIFIAFIYATVSEIHPFGMPPSQMDDYFINNGQKETGANNIVTAILFDYRGLDTLGEATVLFTAVTGVYMLFTKRK